MILDKNNSGRNIYFTEEKWFILNPPLNKTTSQIRLDNKGLEEYNSGKGKLFEKIANPVPKYPKGFIVANDISYNGIGKLIFVLGTMKSFSYQQTLKFYEEDIKRLGEKLNFQQYKVHCLAGKISMEIINTEFANHLDFCPVNSPDLSPIEEL